MLYHRLHHCMVMRTCKRVWSTARMMLTHVNCCDWQEVSVGGQDVVYKDIIEPLESVSVAITPSDKDDITLYGEPLDVSAPAISPGLLHNSTMRRVAC
jgi:PsbP